MTARTKRPRVSFKALGCRVNFEELECLQGRFVDAGYESVPFGATAEVSVINTCTVTAFADADSRKIIRRAVRNKPPGALVIVTGCYAQRDPVALRALEGVDIVLGNTEKAELFEHVARHRSDHRLAGDLWVRDVPRTQRFLRHGRGETERTRATLKIQDGCDEGCTYCIIPSVRGVSTSRDANEVLSEAKHLASLGFREIALTGVNTGCYGHDLGQSDGLARLLARLADLELPLRYRLNSLEPATVTPALLDTIADRSCFCQHFHIPLQHGDSTMLRRMGRNYDAEFYRDIVTSIHERFPEAGIGADVIVGFPGEDDASFARGVEFVESLPCSYLHVFSYSQRSGTPATRMSGHLAAEVKKQRSRALHQVESNLRRAFQRRLLGTEESVLIEAKPGPAGGPSGLTSSYLRVELDRGRENELWQVRIGPSRSDKLVAATAIRRLDFTELFRRDCPQSLGSECRSE